MYVLEICIWACLGTFITINKPIQEFKILISCLSRYFLKAIVAVMAVADMLRFRRLLNILP